MRGSVVSLLQDQQHTGLSVAVWLFHCCSLPKNLKYLLVVIRGFAAGPFCIQAPGRVEISKPWLIYDRIFSLLLSSLGLCTTISAVIWTEYTGTVGLSHYTNIGSYFILYTAPSIPFLRTWRYKKIVDVINRWLLYFDEPWSEDTRVVQQMWFVWIFWLIMEIPIACLIIPKIYFLRLGQFGYIPFLLNDLMFFSIEAGFVFCILILNKQFQDINTELQEKIRVLQRRGVLLRSRKDLFNFNRNLTNLNNCNDDLQSPEMCLNKLRGRHEFLVEILNDIVIAYRVPIVTSISYVIVQVVTNLFNWFVFGSVRPTAWAMIYLSKLFIFISHGHFTLAQARDVIKNVHEVMNESAITKREWEEMIGLAATNLIMLTQFHIST